jgi:hypothetical protein
MTKHKELVFRFENSDQMEAFKSWMNNSGEQDYWQAMEDADEHNVVNIFDYDDENNVVNCKYILE